MTISDLQMGTYYVFYKNTADWFEAKDSLLVVGAKVSDPSAPLGEGDNALKLTTTKALNDLSGITVLKTAGNKTTIVTDAKLLKDSATVSYLSLPSAAVGDQYTVVATNDEAARLFGDSIKTPVAAKTKHVEVAADQSILLTGTGLTDRTIAVFDADGSKVTLTDQIFDLTDSALVTVGAWTYTVVLDPSVTDAAGIHSAATEEASGGETLLTLTGDALDLEQIESTNFVVLKTAQGGATTKIDASGYVKGQDENTVTLTVDAAAAGDTFTVFAKNTAFKDDAGAAFTVSISSAPIL